MIRTVPHRLHVERRLLSALFIWPMYLPAVSLEPSHFHSPVHAVLYQALQEAGDALLPDAGAMPALLDVVRRRRWIGVFKSVGGVEEYVITRLIPIPVQRRELFDLIAIVRECPRCGK